MILFLLAHSAMGAVTCGSVNPERTIKGERCGMTDVAAAMTIIGTFASVATGADANASGVSPKPANICTCSCTTISCAIRLVVSGARPVSSLTRSSTLRPATVSVLRAMYRRHAASICLPVDANGPVSGRMSAILSGSAANTKRGAQAAAAAVAASPLMKRRRAKELRLIMKSLRQIRSIGICAVHASPVSSIGFDSGTAPMRLQPCRQRTATREESRAVSRPAPRSGSYVNGPRLRLIMLACNVTTK